MDNRIKINSITIKNFRSIKNLTIKVNDFNVFVGVNDAGKSNILKALNLFFNEKVDSEFELDFKRDFSLLYSPESKQAKAITISILFSIPITFSYSGDYVWTKVWKETGKVEDYIKKQNGDDLSPRSRIPTALRRVKYRYVPAVKSAEYYKSLLSDLYLSVAASLDTTLKDSIDSFSNQLGTYTSLISEDVAERLGLSSKLTIPTDLKDIFKALVFRTERENTETQIPLTSRGDGIQARHIPIVLKYIAQEDQKSRNQGAAKVTTIWGFEEPENGLELAKAFSLADEFIEYSSEIQIFVTTHSPAFYMKKEDDGAKVYYVEKKSKTSEETTISSTPNSTSIADKMGLMPIVAPFIAETAQKLHIAEEIYEKNFLTDIPTILVEGETDVDYLKLAFKHLSPELSKMVESHEIRIIFKNDGAGTTQLCDWAVSWAYSGFKSKMLILLDRDEAGLNACNEINNNDVIKMRSKPILMKVLKIEPSQEIIDLLSKNINITYEIEHLCSTDVWKKWKENDLVSIRSDTELRKMFDGLIPRNKSLDNIIDELINNIDIRDTILSFEPKKLHKKQMVKVLKDNYEHDANAFIGFSKTIQRIHDYFIKSN